MSEQRQYSENPDIQWALNLLKPDPNYESSILQKYTSEILCIGCAFAAGCIRNVAISRPIFAGVQMHVASIVGGYMVSQLANTVIDHFKAERDTRLRTYVMLHPELFPEPVRVKNADILEPWTPIR
ncbi:uncharacterized protein LOC116844340 [Odontomachus brunneus]|uniref:uncharacterized protein LOC116844340 n=1 Tax=Odontomachus brunneus TaxID=486640 RepID=UPI0013F18531|nr:uncharacterized protein LOC116844340 [Odontomachus brunneus]XP_032671638.1 uncharacterized protein LOC116844340 [Odontomachus brunneus]